MPNANLTSYQKMFTMQKSSYSVFSLFKSLNCDIKVFKQALEDYLCVDSFKVVEKFT
jgi:hypothetical protein